MIVIGFQIILIKYHVYIQEDKTLAFFQTLQMVLCILKVVFNESPISLSK